LRILFEKCETQIDNKTIITITGKYGERGYSFTSDDYDNYSLHLTDQYFVSHASLNCTDISQRLRLQGKYNDVELKNGLMKLTLWTTVELQDIIQNFYVKFIKEIENYIMECEKWEDIIDLIEGIIDNGNFKFGKYMKYIDVSKKRKNLKPFKHYDSKNNGYKLIIIEDMNDIEISEWCNEVNLPSYICINKINNDLTVDEFVEKFGEKKNKIEFIKLIENVSIEYINSIIDLFNFTNTNTQIRHVTQQWIAERIKQQKNNIWYDNIRSTWQKYSKNDYENESKSGLMKASRRINLCYDNDDNLNLCIIYWDSMKQLAKNTTDFIKKTPYIICGNKVKYSVLKEEFQEVNKILKYSSNKDNEQFIDEGLPNKYYWKTPDGWLYLYDKDKPEIISLNVVSPLPSNILRNQLPPKIILINQDVELFTQLCCKKTEHPKLRFSIKEMYKIYETWCKINGKKYLKTQKKFKEELEKLNFKEEKCKGVDINNTPCKKGYNIMVSI
jgi:hypothetical protein